jgi:hypothetical protein
MTVVHLLLIAVILLSTYVYTVEKKLDVQTKQQTELCTKLLGLLEKQTTVNDAQRNFNDSMVDLIKAHAEAIDDNSVNIETLAKSDLSA